MRPGKLNVTSGSANSIGVQNTVKAPVSTTTSESIRLASSSAQSIASVVASNSQHHQQHPHGQQAPVGAVGEFPENFLEHGEDTVSNAGSSVQQSLVAPLQQDPSQATAKLLVLTSLVPVTTGDATPVSAPASTPANISTTLAHLATLPQLPPGVTNAVIPSPAAAVFTNGIPNTLRGYLAVKLEVGDSVTKPVINVTNSVSPHLGISAENLQLQQALSNCAIVYQNGTPCLTIDSNSAAVLPQHLFLTDPSGSTMSPETKSSSVAAMASSIISGMLNNVQESSGMENPTVQWLRLAATQETGTGVGEPLASPSQLSDYASSDSPGLSVTGGSAEEGGSSGGGFGGEGEKDIYIDTKELCSRIAYELKAHSIPQAVFAERVLGRSQGTLSDLLRNPKPWNKLKSGRETFRRMYSWCRQPLPQRLAVLELWKLGVFSSAKSWGKTSLKRKYPPKDRFETDEPLLLPEPPPLSKLIKRPRLVFTDIQKRTLQAIFKETQRPSKEMQKTIAEHLGLDLSTVQNFFMNARRRCRDRFSGDLPRPHQRVRAVTPPPGAAIGTGNSQEADDLAHPEANSVGGAIDSVIESVGVGDSVGMPVSSGGAQGGTPGTLAGTVGMPRKLTAASGRLVARPTIRKISAPVRVLGVEPKVEPLDSNGGSQGPVLMSENAVDSVDAIIEEVRARVCGSNGSSTHRNLMGVGDTMILSAGQLDYWDEGKTGRKNNALGSPDGSDPTVVTAGVAAATAYFGEGLPLIDTLIRSECDAMEKDVVKPLFNVSGRSASSEDGARDVASGDSPGENESFIPLCAMRPEPTEGGEEERENLQLEGHKNMGTIAEDMGSLQS